MWIVDIREQKHIESYLKERNLLKQYKKSKIFILTGIYGKTDLKYRKPKEEGVISFRINKQFRAHGYMVDDVLIVYEISNHQEK